MRKALLFHMLLALLLLPSPAWPQDSTLTFDGGATRIVETHGDWTVDCRIHEGKRVCAVTQSRHDRKTGKRIVMIELQATVDGQARGGIMFPAGLKQGAGVRVGLDGKMSEQPLSIRECSERGCAAVFNFAKVAFDKLRAGKVLELHVTGGDGRPAAYGLSLVGFDSAVRRSLALPD